MLFISTAPLPEKRKDTLSLGPVLQRPCSQPCCRLKQSTLLCLAMPRLTPTPFAREEQAKSHWSCHSLRFGCCPSLGAENVHGGHGAEGWQEAQGPRFLEKQHERWHTRLSWCWRFYGNWVIRDLKLLPSAHLSSFFSPSPQQDRLCFTKATQYSQELQYWWARSAIFNHSLIWRSQTTRQDLPSSGTGFFVCLFGLGFLCTLHLVTFKYQTHKIKFGRYSTEKKVVKYIWKINPCIFMGGRRTEEVRHVLLL